MDNLYRQMLLPFLGLFTSVGTLICCALPALLVSVGMGAAMAGLITAAPWITALSAYKGVVFALSGALLVIAGFVHWRARFAPCPIDPAKAAMCKTLRRLNVYMLGFAAILYVIGFFFAFLAKYVLF